MGTLTARLAFRQITHPTGRRGASIVMVPTPQWTPSYSPAESVTGANPAAGADAHEVGGWCRRCTRSRPPPGGGTSPRRKDQDAAHVGGVSKQNQSTDSPPPATVLGGGPGRHPSRTRRVKRKRTSTWYSSPAVSRSSAPSKDHHTAPPSCTHCPTRPDQRQHRFQHPERDGVLAGVAHRAVSGTAAQPLLELVAPVPVPFRSPFRCRCRCRCRRRCRCPRFPRCPGVVGSPRRPRRRPARSRTGSGRKRGEGVSSMLSVSRRYDQAQQPGWSRGCGLGARARVWLSSSRRAGNTRASALAGRGGVRRRGLARKSCHPVRIER